MGSGVSPPRCTPMRLTQEQNPEPGSPLGIGHSWLAQAPAGRSVGGHPGLLSIVCGAHTPWGGSCLPSSEPGMGSPPSAHILWVCLFCQAAWFCQSAQPCAMTPTSTAFLCLGEFWGGQGDTPPGEAISGKIHELALASCLSG